jgi:hypothetical protein
MAKAKTIALGQPLPLSFHPKDTENGILFRPLGGLGAGPSQRNTVYISCGGAQVEMTIEAAQKFADQLACAINCVREK